ncbi:MAG: hypothetical protein QM714_08235 [Nocardioides sp.]|uniref:hypothetical protein n=1 Tax=Nocardioides sp. TaxID=35761 RepID=UPI0039E28FFC
MTHDTEGRLAVLMHNVTDELVPDDHLITSAMAVGDRRRRRRGLAMGGAALATVAVLGTTWATTLQPAAPDRTATPARGDLDTTSYAAGEQNPPTVRIATPTELSTILADALPGPSTEVSLERVAQRSQAERLFQGGAVDAMAYDYDAVLGQSIDPDLMQQRCMQMQESRRTGCVSTDDGWAVWTIGRPDVAGADPGVVTARVTYFRRDGKVIDLRASNGPAVDADPVAASPVVSRGDLVDLAIHGNWFPVE